MKEKKYQISDRQKEAIERHIYSKVGYFLELVTNSYISSIQETLSQASIGEPDGASNKVARNSRTVMNAREILAKEVADYVDDMLCIGKDFY